MPRICTVCTHPRRQAIDKALVAGTLKSDVSALFRVSRDAVDRHSAARGASPRRAHGARPRSATGHRRTCCGRPSGVGRATRQRGGAAPGLPPGALAWCPVRYGPRTPLHPECLRRGSQDRDMGGPAAVAGCGRRWARRLRKCAAIPPRTGPSVAACAERRLRGAAWRSVRAATRTPIGGWWWRTKPPDAAAPAYRTKLRSR
jgi:hypothetical protein